MVNGEETVGILYYQAATGDSEVMWQTGINVLPEAEGLGIETMFAGILKNDIPDMCKITFYVTEMSHISSQKSCTVCRFLFCV